MENEEKPAYYSIIPAIVRYDRELKANEKLLYGEITALCDKLGYCWATNEYFANLYDVSKETASRWINHLIKKGYLFSQIIYKENSSEILNRVIKLEKNLDVDISKFYRKRDIYPIDEKINTVLTKKSIEYRQKNQGAIDENVKENNTSINNTSINIKENIKRKNIEDIISYLNSKTGSSFRYSSRATQQKINARFNEGYTFEDFISVIDKKVNEWQGTEFEQYLCPETLFGTKFEKYLNQKIKLKEETFEERLKRQREIEEQERNAKK